MSTSGYKKNLSHSLGSGKVSYTIMHAFTYTPSHFRQPDAVE